MSFLESHRGRFTSVVISTIVATSIISAQTPQRPADDPDVIRISTELVQTGVVVLDKQGKFVEGLKPEQFVLKVDGKPVTPVFFEQVAAGTSREEKLEKAATRGAGTAMPTADPGDVSYLGRTIVFFIDDLHLSPESVLKTRKAVTEFINNQMGNEDRVAIASASGQIGFLQQFTEVKPVLHAAVARLNHKPYTVRDAENITMTEYQALKVDQGDKDTTDHFVEELLKATNFRIRGVGGLGPPGGGMANTRGPQSQGLSGGMTRESAQRMVKERAMSLLRQASSVTTNTLETLESLMRSSERMAGRKLVFFISDGFFLNDRNTAFSDKLKQITDAALRAGVVIYSMDARGLVSSTDASSNRADPIGRLARSNIGEVAAAQDGLSVLAADTGGRLSTGALTTAVADALRETSNYYLLAWRPQSEEQKGVNYKRIEVSVVGRPELSVRLPRGFMLGPMEAPPKADVAKAGAGDNQSKPADPVKGLERTLMSALSASSARTDLPLKLDVSFIDVPNSGPVLTAATLMSTDVLGYGTDGKQPAAIDLAGVVLNDQGKQAGSFKTRVNVKPVQNASVHNPGVIYTHKLPMKPGIYQVRVAARDDQSGRVGSEAKWFEVPDLSSKRLLLSSLLVGGQFVGSGTNAAGGEQMQFSVDRRFAKGANLNFLTFVYNAVSSPAPEVDAQIKILRNGRAIVTSPVRKVPIDASTDPARIVYGANIALQTLPVGRYLLEVTVTDRLARTSASRYVSFDIE